MSRSSDIILFVALEADDPQRYDRSLPLTNYAQPQRCRRTFSTRRSRAGRGFRIGQLFDACGSTLEKSACVALLPQMSPLQ